MLLVTGERSPAEPIGVLVAEQSAAAERAAVQHARVDAFDAAR
ncbi:hypothetical protein [Kribbella sp. NPDC006257]